MGYFEGSFEVQGFRVWGFREASHETPRLDAEKYKSLVG